MSLYAPPFPAHQSPKQTALAEGQGGLSDGVPCTRVLVYCVCRFCGAPHMLQAPYGAGARQRCPCMCRAAVVGGQAIAECDAGAVLWVDTLAVLQLLMTKSMADKVTESP